MFRHNNGEIAAVIIEPVAGNMGCVLPENDFLQNLRRICDENGTLLIFDEVMTGFRLAFGGAQELFNVKADLVTYGKVIGGGLLQEEMKLWIILPQKAAFIRQEP